jgi:hypothetical protein
MIDRRSKTQKNNIKKTQNKIKTIIKYLLYDDNFILGLTKYCEYLYVIPRVILYHPRLYIMIHDDNDDDDCDDDDDNDRDNDDSDDSNID